VYVDFTGPLPWETRVWAALLTCGPGAALTGQTALRAHGVDGHQRDDRIHVAVPHARRVDPKPGVVLSRHRDLSAILHSSRRPRTVRLEIALLLTASAQQDVSRRAAVLLDACRQRRTTPDRILAELPALPSLAGRSTLRRILADASDGVQSFLEHAYEQGVVYRDTEYEPYGVIVELDGQAGHADSISRWRDMTRDNAAATSSKLTLRFGYQLVSEPCAVAAQVVAALHLRGWPGRPRRCSPACRL
jgi:hypothetical protein